MRKSDLERGLRKSVAPRICLQVVCLKKDKSVPLVWYRLKKTNLDAAKMKGVPPFPFE